MLTEDEFAEWEAFYALEPFGPRAETLQQAISASTLANAFRKPGSDPFEAVQFAIGDPDDLGHTSPHADESLLRCLFASRADGGGRDGDT